MQIELTITQLIGIGLTLLVGLILLGFLVTKIFRKFHSPDMIGYSRKQIQERWTEIEALVDQKSAMSYKLAIIEADKLLDHTLKALGFPGENMGQRLKAACYRHEKVRRAWFGHKLRNQLVHEASFQITYWQAKDAIRSFEAAFKALN